VRTAAARLLEALAARNITDEWPVISGPMKALRAALASAPGQGAEERARMLFDAKNHWADRARKAEAELARLKSTPAAGVPEEPPLRFGIKEPGAEGRIIARFFYSTDRDLAYSKYPSGFLPVLLTPSPGGAGVVVPESKLRALLKEFDGFDLDDLKDSVADLVRFAQAALARPADGSGEEVRP
jgi:hypothetical protein